MTFNGSIAVTLTTPISTATPITMATDITMPTTPLLSNYTQSEIDHYLEYLDNENAKLMVPTLVYISLLIITGLFGNILVLVVYINRFKASTPRVFIISLAVFDLMNNTMAQPGEILDIYYANRFTNNHLCKLKRFFNYFTTFCSIFSLVVVAVDRYRKVCMAMALTRQITEHKAKILVGCVVLCSLTICFPSLVLNGVKKIPTGRPDVLGTECKYADNFQDALFPKIFLGFQFLLFLSSLTAMTVMYLLIGRTVYHHSSFNFKNNRNSTLTKPIIKGNYSGSEPSSASSFSSPGSVRNATQQPKRSPANDPENDQSKPQETSDVDKKPYVITMPPTCIIHNMQEKVTRWIHSQPSPGFDNTIATSQRARQTVKPKKMNTRTTLMLCVITIVFVLSYLPYLSISIVKVINKNFVNSLSTSAFMAYNVILRSHYINSAVNPLVYSFCNVKFRAEVKHILCFWKSKSQNIQYR